MASKTTQSRKCLSKNQLFVNAGLPGGKITSPSVLLCSLVKVASMATRGGECLRSSGPEEYLCDFEREPLNNVRINQEMMKSLGKL